MNSYAEVICSENICHDKGVHAIYMDCVSRYLSSHYDSFQMCANVTNGYVCYVVQKW